MRLDHLFKIVDVGQLGIIDPDARAIVVHLYDGMVKVIPLDPQGMLQEAYNLRLLPNGPS